MEQAEGEIVETPAEVLYHAMLPSLPQYMVGLFYLFYYYYYYYYYIFIDVLLWLVCYSKYQPF